MKKILVNQDPENEVPFEVMAKCIETISKSMEQIHKTRVTRKMIVALIQDKSNLSKSTIELVLNNLEALEENYLKKKPKKGE
jgi:hypothetical protein